jgi:LPXTG-motif cell wall-anchored protein
MDNQTLSAILWIAAGLVLVLLIMRRKKRKTFK